MEPLRFGTRPRMCHMPTRETSGWAMMTSRASRSRWETHARTDRFDREELSPQPCQNLYLYVWSRGPSSRPCDELVRLKKLCTLHRPLLAVRRLTGWRRVISAVPWCGPSTWTTTWALSATRENTPWLTFSKRAWIWNKQVRLPNTLLGKFIYFFNREK